MGKILKFERKPRVKFDKYVAANDLIEFAENMRDDSVDGEIDKVLVIFRQNGQYGIGGWGETDRNEARKILAELRKFFIDIGAIK